MAPRKDDDFMDVDYDSDISIPDVAEDFGARKGKGKAKAGEKRKRDKGKGKAKDAVNTSLSCRPLVLTQKSRQLASIHMGGVVHAILGHGAGGRGGQSARLSRGMDGAWPKTAVCLPPSLLPSKLPYPSLLVKQ
jgi:hypothetical protein